MIKYKGYKILDIMKFLDKKFSIKDIETILFKLNDYDELIELKKDYKYITSANFVKITKSNDFFDTLSCYTDTDKIELFSNNVNTDNAVLIRINKNDIISPKLEFKGDFVIATKDLDEWLLYNSFTKELLHSIENFFEISRTYEFKDLRDIEVRNLEVIELYESLKLDEKDLKKALESIENLEIREKIDLIINYYGKLKY